MVWHDLALGPAITFYVCARFSDVEIIDTGGSLPLEEDSRFSNNSGIALR